METVVKLDKKKRLTLPQGKPGSHLSITVNGDGSFTLTPVKEAVERAPSARLVKRGGRTYLRSGHPLNMEAVNEMLKEFP
jgi:hypothetical protein